MEEAVETDVFAVAVVRAALVGDDDDDDAATRRAKKKLETSKISAEDDFTINYMYNRGFFFFSFFNRPPGVFVYRVSRGLASIERVRVAPPSKFSLFLAYGARSNSFRRRGSGPNLEDASRLSFFFLYNTMIFTLFI